jgi:hypothetical protein
LRVGNIFVRIFVLHVRIDLRDLRISTLIGIIMLGYRTLPRSKMRVPKYVWIVSGKCVNGRFVVVTVL